MTYSRALISVAICAVTAIACSDRGNLPDLPGPVGANVRPTGPNGDGLWRGQMTSTDSGLSQEAVLLIRGGRWDWRLLSEDGQFIERDENNSSGRSISFSETEVRIDFSGFALEGLTWLDGSKVADFLLNATILRQSTITGEWSGAGDNGTISLSYEPVTELFFRVYDANRATGMWVLRDPSQNITATFDIVEANSFSVAINGSDAEGCIYAGRFEENDWSSGSVFDAFLTLENCPTVDGASMNGNYDGAGVVTDLVAGSRQDDQLIIMVDDDSRVISLVLEKI